MVDFQQSSQLNAWLYGKPEHLTWCREKANFMARTELHNLADDPPAQRDPTQASSDARGWLQRYRIGLENPEAYGPNRGPTENYKGKAMLSAQEEAMLVSWYAPKLPSLIGQKSKVIRLRRDSKVTATAAMLYRRFFLSNSVMMYDPKAIMVAAAFLASKIEDASVELKHLEECTIITDSHVSQDEILAAELALIQGTAFELLCFHPYKAVLALTEDLRTFLKSDKGKALLHGRQQVSGQDLIPLFDQAKIFLEDAILRTDLALLYTPGQLALAGLVAAQDALQEKASHGRDQPLQIDWQGYVNHRFEDFGDNKKEATWHALQELRIALREPKPPTDMAALKSIHKKLKKVRVWTSSSDTSNKRKKEDADAEFKLAKRIKKE